MKALVLLSGGIDSTVATWWAVEQGYEVHALTFNYFKRPEPEIRATRAVAEEAGIELTELELPWLRELDDPVHPLLDNPELEDAPYGYVPGRNAMFYSIGAHLAEILGADVLVGGHNGVDPETFPDASARFFDDLGDLLAKGLATQPSLTIEQPLHGMEKPAVVDLGLELGAPMALSWSCYEEGPDPCGACPSCEQRAAAFEQLGHGDPARQTAGCPG